MASFVEQATLLVKDGSSAQINKINAALKNLFKTARSLKSATANISINTKGLKLAQQQIKGLSANVRALNASAKATRIAVNTSGVTAAQRQINLLRAAAAKPIKVTMQQVGRMQQPQPPGARGGGGGGGGRRGLVSRVANTYAVHEATRAVSHAVKEGVNDSTIGESSLKLKQLDRIVGPGTEKSAREAIRSVGKEKAGMPGGAMLSAGQRTGLFSEALGVTNLNVESAKGLTSGMEELIRSGVILGQSFDDAREGAINYGKAAEMMGRTTFHNADEAAAVGKKIGDFDEKRTKATFDYFQAIQPEIGKEMTGTFTKQISKYLGSARFAMSDRALGAVLMMGEEEGTRAAVGFRQATKQLSGQGLKVQQLQNQIQDGLVNTEEVKKESRKGKITTVTQATGAKDRQLLAKDLPQYVTKKIAPLAEKHGLDLSKPEDAVKLAQRYASDTTAVETIAALLYRGKEIQQKLDTIDKREQGADVVRRLTQGDVRATMTGLSNQLQSVTGEAVMALAPAFTPILHGMTSGMQTMGETIKAATAGDKEAQAKITTGALATAVLGAPALKMATQVMAPLIKPLGLIAGLQAMTSADPAVRGLGAAGVSLQAAASELSAAAGVMAGKGVLDAVTGGGKPADTVKEAGKTGAIVAAMTRWGIPLATLAATLSLGGDTMSKEGSYANATPEERDRMVALAHAQSALYETTKRLSDLQEQKVAPAESKGFDKFQPKYIEQFDSEVSALTAKVANLRSEITRLSVPGESATKPPSWVDDAVKAMKAYKPSEIKPSEAKPSPFGDPSQPSKAQDIKDAASTLQSTTSAFSTTFLQGTSALQSTEASFPAVFATGAMTIGQSGNTVVSTLSGAAPGIGATIGNAAAAAIQAAVANINVNVNANVSGGGGDKGSQKAAPGGG